MIPRLPRRVRSTPAAAQREARMFRRPSEKTGSNQAQT